MLNFSPKNQAQYTNKRYAYKSKRWSSTALDYPSLLIFFTQLINLVRKHWLFFKYRIFEYIAFW